MLSAICFNLDQSKILSSGNRFITKTVVKMGILETKIRCDNGMKKNNFMKVLWQKGKSFNPD